MHEVVFELIKDKLGHKKSVKVLDVVTRACAFSQRIADHFLGWDLEVNDFENQAIVTGFRLRKYDLNDSFSGKFPGVGYDLVSAFEIIVHLENTLNFLRKIRKMFS